MTTDLEGICRDLCGAFGLPAVALATWKADQLETAVTGTLNADTGLEARSDSIFQIGSITKVLTALTVLSLLDARGLGPETHLNAIVPKWRHIDPRAQDITIAMLLSHTSGIDGDFLMDDDDGPARYVDKCYAVPLVFAPGSAWSYSNAGYAILGYVAEVLGGMPWATLVERYVFEPLGLEQSVLDPKTLCLHSIGAGHIMRGEGGGYDRVQTINAGRSMRPAGIFAFQSPGDLIRLAVAFLERHGAIKAKLWDQALSPAASLPIPNALKAQSWSYGLTLFDDGAFGHAGGTAGDTSLLRVYPQDGRAFSIQINAAGAGLREALNLAVERLKDHLGINAATPKLQGPLDVPDGDFVGDYESISYACKVRSSSKGLTLALRGKPNGDASVMSLTSLSADGFEAKDADTGATQALITFVRPAPEKACRGLYYAGRFLPLVGGTHAR